MYAKPKTNFTRMKDGEFGAFAHKVLESMTDNPDFPNPDPPLAVLTEDLEHFQVALANSTFGGRLSTEEKRQQRKKLQETMDLIAIYVRRVAQGDPAIVLSSGFDHNKPKSPPEPCPKPEWIRIENGPVGSGWLVLRTKPYRKARSYQFEYRPEGTEVWIQALSSKSTIRLDELEKFRTYEFRVAYRGTYPSITYSEVVVGYAA